ncbi:hypothetical protein QUB17_19250 [Microcoleus sp. B5-C4]
MNTILCQLHVAVARSLYRQAVQDFLHSAFQANYAGSIPAARLCL